MISGVVANAKSRQGPPILGIHIVVSHTPCVIGRKPAKQRRAYKAASRGQDMRKAAVITTTFLVLGCTFSEPRLRPEPVSSVPLPGNAFSRSSLYGMFATRNVSVAKSLNGMEFRCAEWRSWNSRLYDSIGSIFTGTTPGGDECIYVTVNPTTLPLTVYGKIAAEPKAITSRTDDGTSASVTPEADPVQLIENTHILLAASDYNCDNFLARAFAAKTNTGFFSSLFSSIISATGAVITPAAGVPDLVPTSLQAGNSAITGGTAAFDANYYAGKSFDIMEAGILAARKQRRAEIYARLCATDTRPQGESSKQDCDIPKTDHYEGYRARGYMDMAEVLSDVTSYDRICSIEGGLKELIEPCKIL
jgi:hypothetical protein